MCHRAVRQNDAILAAHRTVLETEEVGLEITRELSRNREKIESSRAKVQYYFDYYRFSNQLDVTISFLRQC